MPIIDSRSDSKFDALIRTNKSDALMSFIMATSTVKEDKNRKELIAKRLKSAYELFRENIRGSDSGAGSYGDGSRDISKQFESHYTMGYEMGIWQDNDFHLNPLASKVAKYELTVSEYIGIVFLNLFSYYKKQGKDTYHHFLLEILKYAQINDNVNAHITKRMIADTLPIDKAVEQANIIFNYLVSSDIFIKIDNETIQLSPKWIKNKTSIFSVCNTEYEDLPLEQVFSLFSNKKFYADYVTKIPEKIGEFDVIKDDYTAITPPYSRQLIFSGAPGTGKSYELNKLANEYFKGDTKTYYKRVTFHPNMNYGQFVGVYKPFPSDNESAPITYKFVPGILLQQLIEAYKNPKHNYLVLIEEINRANTAAVFGDAFQLLDRTKGESDYPIAISEDIRTYLEEQNILSEELTEIDAIKVKNKLENEGLYFPKNFYIWASMNEADQGVLPMDTAFKRRWDFEKFDINDLGEEGKEFFSDKVIKTCNGAINWNKLRMAINSKLLDLSVPEGKLMGPYFISKETLEDEEKIKKAFETKVLMYLFEDAVRTRPTLLFDIENSQKHYGALVDKFNEIGIAIFRDIDLSNDIEPYEELSEELETSETIKEFNINDYEDRLGSNQKEILNYLIEKSNELSKTKILDNTKGNNGLYFIEENMDIPQKQAGKNKYLHVRNSSLKVSGKLIIFLRIPYEESKEYPNTKNTLGKPGAFTTEIKLESKEDVDSIIELIGKSIAYTSNSTK